MTTKHTPGPWMVRQCGSGYAIDYNADQEQICDHVYELPDARLIAAAPQLLLALQDAEAILRGALGEIPAVKNRVEGYARIIALAILDTDEQSGL